MKNTITSAIAVAAVLLLASPAAAAGELKIDGIQNQYSLYPGENITDQLSVSYTGEVDTVAYLSVNIEAEDTNSEGISADFSRNPVIAPSEGENNVGLEISTSSILVPDNFTVTVKGETELEEKEVVETVTYEEVVNNTVYRNRTNESDVEEDVVEDLNQSLNEKDKQIQQLKKNNSLILENNKNLMQQNTNYKAATILLAAAVLLTAAGLILTTRGV